MKFIACLMLTIWFAGTASAQALAMTAPSAAQDFVFKIDKVNSKIDVYKNGSNQVMNASFKVSMLELEIFDAKGEYAGTLELNAFNLPAEEIADYEKLKIAAIVLTDSKTGEEIIINDVLVHDK